ncbi:DUF4381 domain-containing protein [Marinomonas atlantica]|uniref:DUF4381 domain-containing protein n=1 Tax=Marinomonas atlantica TaxID=1806668 RepID=UPI00082DD83D|nr:DUF4381 domain-containing protein [Marinomonas atlantica]MCO4785327.1 DUF4381 domain-containing protein [Marinomonas atlantica]
MSNAIDLPNTAYLLPEAIPNWPPVWWSWLVLAAFLLLTVIIITIAALRHKRRIYRYEALQALKEVEQASDKVLIESCISVIKRCLITEGHETLASCTTKALLPILDQQLKRAKWTFTEFEPIFTEGLYRPDSQLTAQQRSDLVQLTSYWIRKHHA